MNTSASAPARTRAPRKSRKPEPVAEPVTELAPEPVAEPVTELAPEPELAPEELSLLKSLLTPPAANHVAELAAVIEEISVGKKMAKTLALARRRYVKTVRPDGDASMDNGDTIARLLREREPLEVAFLADQVCKAQTGWHKAKYASLNPGQIRMNSGNKIRGAWRKAMAAEDRAEQVRIADLVGFVIEFETEEEAA